MCGMERGALILTTGQRELLPPVQFLRKSSRNWPQGTERLAPLPGSQPEAAFGLTSKRFFIRPGENRAGHATRICAQHASTRALNTPQSRTKPPITHKSRIIPHKPLRPLVPARYTKPTETLGGVQPVNMSIV
jgi:hypothetical protein